MTYRIWFWLAIAGAPLIIYPVVLVANIMSLGAEPPIQPPPLALRLTSQGFLWGSTVYPIIYLSCAVPAIIQRVAKPKLALNLAALPLLYLTILAALFCGWMITGGLND
jgi:hypothetical protein